MTSVNAFDRLAYVDLETTGGRPTRDRITEIGIVLVDNHVVIEEWSSLINPHTHIPSNIQNLTGITQKMVSKAPDFDEVIERVLEKLGDRVLVAHNARFDVGFLRNEFRRQQLEFKYPVVCTVKLSRHLYPHYRRHNLDTLMARYHLGCEARHRALGDARVLPDLVNAMIAQSGLDTVVQAMKAQQKLLSLPPHLPSSLLDELPHRPGVYLFYGENDSLLYVGKSVNIRSRVMSHFTDDHRHDREMRIAQQVRQIDWIETAGEFGALMLEAELIKTRSPLLNRRLRRQQELCSIKWNPDETKKPEVVAIDTISPYQLSHLYGLFRTRRQAINTLRKLSVEYFLCPRKIGLEKGKGACFAYQLKKCKGVCCGKELEILHRQRVLQALLPLRVKAWPYEGAIGIREYQAETDRTDIHIISHWCYLGKVQNEEELASFSMPESFYLDKDVYRLCLQQLRKRPEIIKLSESILRLCC